MYLISQEFDKTCSLTLVKEVLKNYKNQKNHPVYALFGGRDVPTVVLFGMSHSHTRIIIAETSVSATTRADSTKSLDMRGVRLFECDRNTRARRQV